MSKTSFARARYGVYALLIVCIGLSVYSLLTDKIFKTNENTRLVTVVGNVEHPGVYRVPGSATNFEVLRIAGVRPTSDLTRFFLAAQVSVDKPLEVGTLANPPAIKPDIGSGRVEFYHGDLSVIATDGRNKSVSEGMSLVNGDRIITESKAQTEATLNTYSRVDIDEVSELVIENLGSVVGNKTVRKLVQKSGVCWYKISYASRAESYKIGTPQGIITVGGGGGDFVVEVGYADIVIHNIEGLLLLERPSGEAINMITGQSATVFSDGRPIQVRSLTSDVNPNIRFGELTKEKTAYLVRSMPLNMLFVGIPMTFYFINIQFEQGKTNIIKIPHATTVDRFVQGVETLDQAMLSGGPVFASTMVERIMNTKIPRYSVITKQHMARIITAIGGITLDVDDDAAAFMKLKRGPQKLTGEQSVQFIRPIISGWAGCEVRQAKVLKALFERIQTGGIVVTTILAKQLATGIETNMTVPDIVSNFTRFGSRKTWQFKNMQIPGKEVSMRGFSLFEADLELCKNMLVAEETK